MKVERYQSSPSFKQVYVTAGAEKLLQRGDKIVRNTKAEFLNSNIPEGHSKPLWNVLKTLLIERQKANKNNIIIDIIVEKGKKLLSVVTYDSKSTPKSKKVVSPFIRKGSLNEIEPPDDMLTYSAYKKSLDKKVYGKSDFFNVIKNAEFEVDDLHLLDMQKMKNVQKSIRELPKEKTTKTTVKRSQTAKTNQQERAHVASILEVKQHRQLPFERLFELNLELPKKAVKTSIQQEAKIKNRLPRKQKKQQARV